MMRLTKFDYRISFHPACIFIILFSNILFLLPQIALAQVLEEIVVTAQQREQSLQEVPISINVYSGAEIDLQGFRNLDDLSKFNPSVAIESGVQEQDVTIRGFGSSGNTRTLMSATPIFLDGVHFGRTSLVKTAFLDTERVEILKGPQPLFLGLNATAGAFNITSRRPTPEWEADLAAEYGNDGRNRLFGAIGGPIMETLGIRLVGLTDRSDGPVKNNVDPTKKVAGYNNLAGRVMLQWNPNDRLEIMTKLEGSWQRNGSELRMGCLTAGPASGYTSRGGPFNDDENTDDSAIGLFGYGSAVLAEPPKGIPYSGPPIQKARRATGQDCFRDKYAFNVEGPYPAKPSNITGEETRTVDGGSVAYEQVADAFWGADGVAPEGEYSQFYGFNAGGVDGKDHIDSINGVFDLTYTFDNGYVVNALTGMIDFNRYDTRDNSPSPFLQNFQARAEDIALWSEQLKVESPSYEFGSGNLDFMIGGVIQDVKMDIHNSFPKDSVRRGVRTNVTWEDVRWYSGFWNVNFNFMDDQLSLQVGGRFTDETRQSFIMGAGNQFIFEGLPCDASGTDANPATCTQDPNFKRVHPELTTYTIVDPVTGNGSQSGREVRVDSPIILVDGVDPDNLWTVSDWNRNRGIPLNYRAPLAQAVGYTAPVYGVEGVNSVRNGPYGKCDNCFADLYSSENGYDSQFVLSFTPNGLDRNHTFYGKYAEAFKGATTDLGAGPIPSNPDDITFDPENSESWEIGAKGRLMDSRVRYDLTAFINTFTDLQTGATAPPFNLDEQGSTSLNAGKQEVKGFEFSSTAAINDNLTLSFAGVLMDGEMKELDGGGCTNSEVIAASIDALTPTAQGGSMENRTAEEISVADENLGFLGNRRRSLLPSRSALPEIFYINGGCRLVEVEDSDGNVIHDANTISRTGDVAPRTPSWSFVLGLDYEYPIFDNYFYYFNAMGFISDGYLTEETTFWRKEKFNTHGDINLTLGIGSQDRSWRLLGYVRNMLEATKSYNPEYDLEFAGIFQSENISPANFIQYGVKFEYNFR